MKYSVFDLKDFLTEEVSRYVNVVNGDNATTFAATIGNPNYDQFLTDAQLTDEQVHALKPDTWFDFPKASK